MELGVFENLRFQGYAPRTLLDIGAHIGTFTQGFLRVFPDCAPTLIEPNPFCHEDLAKLPYERHAVAASAEAGKAELFLTKEWLQSTGSSLYRENTAFFRDEVVIRQEVDKVRLDDLFRGRRFDFVKIDTQGSELDVLLGGREVLRQADYILIEVSLVEYNIGGAAPEAIFALLAGMGFRCADVTDFHRLRGVQDGGLLQMDFLFERQVRRPTQNYRYAALGDQGALMDHLRAQKARCPDLSVIGVGPATSPGWAELMTASIGPRESPAPLKFAGDLNDARSWEPALQHVARQGRFSFAVCSHVLENLAYPALALEMLPQIAEAGFVAGPSRFLQSLRPEGPYRGFVQHRWVLDPDPGGGPLLLAPKTGLLEHMALNDEPSWQAAPHRFEFQMIWRGAIAFELFGADQAGSSLQNVIAAYGRFFDRP